jgi:hypothetical protein
MVASLHRIAATVLQQPLLAIDQQEAEMLTRAGANVARHYDLGVVSPVVVDWFGLISTAGTVYGTRIVAARLQAARAAAEAAQAQPAQPFPDVSGNPPPPMGNVVDLPR